MNLTWEAGQISDERHAVDATAGSRCGPHLSVGVSVVLVCPGLVILLYESKVFLPLALQDQLLAPPVGRQVALRRGRGEKLASAELALRYD